MSEPLDPRLVQQQQALQQQQQVYQQQIHHQQLQLQQQQQPFNKQRQEPMDGSPQHNLQIGQPHGKHLPSLEGPGTSSSTVLTQCAQFLAQIVPQRVSVGSGPVYPFLQSFVSDTQHGKRPSFFVQPDDMETPAEQPLSTFCGPGTSAQTLQTAGEHLLWPQQQQQIHQQRQKHTGISSMDPNLQSKKPHGEHLPLSNGSGLSGQKASSNALPAQCMHRMVLHLQQQDNCGQVNPSQQPSFSDITHGRRSPSFTLLDGIGAPAKQPLHAGDFTCEIIAGECTRRVPGRVSERKLQLLGSDIPGATLSTAAIDDVITHCACRAFIVVKLNNNQAYLACLTINNAVPKFHEMSIRVRNNHSSLLPYNIAEEQFSRVIPPQQQQDRPGLQQTVIGREFILWPFPDDSDVNLNIIGKHCITITQPPPQPPPEPWSESLGPRWRASNYIGRACRSVCHLCSEGTPTLLRVAKKIQEERGGLDNFSITGSSTKRITPDEPTKACKWTYAIYVQVHVRSIWAWAPIIVDGCIGPVKHNLWVEDRRMLRSHVNQMRSPAGQEPVPGRSVWHSHNRLPVNVILNTWSLPKPRELESFSSLSSSSSPSANTMPMSTKEAISRWASSARASSRPRREPSPVRKPESSRSSGPEPRRSSSSSSLSPFNTGTSSELEVPQSRRSSRIRRAPKWFDPYRMF